MQAHIFDSEIYGHLWATPEVRELFGDRGRTQAWLDVLAALALAQADLELIPEAAAREIEERARVELLDLGLVARRNRETGHSTLGLIEGFKAVLGPEAREWVYFGATVQDLTDTWTALAMREVLDLARRDLERIESALARHAREHRDTLMLGRTHGQAGLPITFGFKAAVWAAEVGRHLERIEGTGPRLAVGQLAGAVGTCSFWGRRGLELQRRFCQRLGLAEPDMVWLTARDRIAEFTCLLAMVTGTIAKIGGEVYNLQRPEIGEVREGFRGGLVGSITMPHKRNPELSEHLGTLARLVRASAALGLEGMVHQHERDGAAWKAEWAFIPEACMATCAALAFGAGLIESLEVDHTRMRGNLADQEGYVLSEPVMGQLATSLGKHRAHELVYRAAMAGLERGVGFREALAADPEVMRNLDEDDLDRLLDPELALGSAGELVDRVLASTRGGR